MASQEHVQQLNDDDDDSTSSSSSSNNEEPVTMQQPPPVAVSSGPPKMRIKLSLRMAPPQRQEQPNAEQPTQDPQPMEVESKQPEAAEPMEVEVEAVTSTNKEKEEVVKATVANDEDLVDAAVVVEPVVSASPAASVTSASNKGSRPSTPAPRATSGGVAAKRTTKPVRLSALSSPGLLLLPGSVRGAGVADANGLVTPATVFNQNMAAAGYSNERTHRGSSVTRVVDDLFDVDVKLSVQFPELVPKEFLEQGADNKPSLVTTLRQALQSKQETCAQNKRIKFSDMVPKSLSVGYPESYVNKYKDYVKAVERREEAIDESQLKSTMTDEEREKAGPTVIPPIPEPPSPPRISELTRKNADSTTETTTDESKHPLYLPKDESLVAHLDKDCFHITRGRYFGLSSNSIADPHFCGASAPGIVGMTVSAGTSLATAYVGHTSAGSASLASTVYGTNTAASTTTAATPKTTTKTPKSTTTKKRKPSKKSSTETPLPKETRATATGSDLKRFMEVGNPDEVEKMRICILRSAVYASRTGNHGRAFMGCDGHSYPDVSKALSVHGGLKPCERCKSNKQGAYHCRLRRKHKDMDYDGGSSMSILDPLWQEPLEDLLYTEP